MRLLGREIKPEQFTMWGLGLAALGHTLRLIELHQEEQAAIKAWFEREMPL